MNIKKVMVPLVAFVIGGILSSMYLPVGLSAGDASESAEKKPLYWVAPMDANFRQDKPGQSPMGMDLVPFYGDDSIGKVPAGTVSISAQTENSLGVKIARVKRQDIHRNIQSMGFLQYDESSIQHYHVRVNGWLETLYINSVGDKVKKGQKLFDLYSPELVYAQEEYIAAMLIGSPSLIEAAGLKMRALGISQRNIAALKKTKKVKQFLTYRAIRDGYISTLKVRQGMYIQPQLEIMGTGDLDTIWVIAEVFERQASWLKTGAEVEMTLAAYPGRKWFGKVDFIFPVLNSENRTVQARVIFKNKKRLLKPNMFAQLEIQASAVNDALVIPSAAIINSANMQRVVLALGEGKFRSVKVQTGIESNGVTQVTAGLDENQQVVHSAQFLIDSESSVNADLSRMQHEKSAKDMSMNEPSSRVWVQGKVTALEGGKALKIQHQAIDEWSWPEMNMSFNVQPDISINHLKKGDAIGFCLDKMPSGQYLITHLEKQSSDPSEMEMNHD
jgi:Cu(I)/Ag(I) efflux system membrane fusion protein